MTNTVLILGGSGRFGRNATQSFKTAGWDVHQFDRQRDDLMTAARGIDVIVAAWNPAYNLWASQVPALHASIRRAALTHDATVIIPGNVYLFGPDTSAPWGAESPHAATNPLGRIRIEMEAAYKREGVRTIVLRSGDFLDSQASGNWFDMIMIKGLAKGRLTYPGRTDIPHAWGYLPDVTRAAVMLAEKRETLERFSDIPFPGYTLSGQEIARHLSDVTGRKIATKPFHWWMLHLARPFLPLAKHLIEMRYLWNTPHSLDHRKFAQILPEFQHTPVDKALATAIYTPDKTTKVRPAVA